MRAADVERTQAMQALEHEAAVRASAAAHAAWHARKLRLRAGRALKHREEVARALEEAIDEPRRLYAMDAHMLDVASAAGRIERYARMLDAAVLVPAADAARDREDIAHRAARRRLADAQRQETPA